MYKELFRRTELQILMSLTAHALRQPSMCIWHLPHLEALKCYAEFTRDNLSDDVSPEILQRMNTQAYRLGRILRLLFLIRRKTTAQQFVVSLYRNIGIAMSFKSEDEIIFHNCFFSRFYTPDVCLAASSLDDGIIRGLTGCGKLTFKQRITEKCKYCLVQYRHEKESNRNW